MSLAIEYRTDDPFPTRTWVLVGGTLVALALPAAVVGALWLASLLGGDLLSQVFAVLSADPTTLGVRASLVYWGVALSAVGAWLVGLGLVVEGLAEN